MTGAAAVDWFGRGTRFPHRRASADSWQDDGVERERHHDLALFGATGFTGGLTAEYLARNGPADLRWALVGRSRTRLERVATRLQEIESAVPAPELVEADANSRSSLDAVAASARVVLTTVGPYLLHGEPLVAACAAAGTDYADLTGEPEFVDRVWLDHHADAERSGARLVHCCGFDSIPHDLGAYFTVSQLPEGVPLAVNGYVKMGASFSGGTYHSAINALAHGRRAAAVAKQRRQREGRPAGRRVRSAKPRVSRQSALGGWSLPLPTIDGSIVRRSAAALDRYGPDFTYGHNLIVANLVAGAALTGGVGAAALLAPLPPARKLMLRAKSPGEGPSEAKRAQSWFRASFVGEGGGERVLTEVSGGDPGYSETSKMLAETGLCLAFDELPVRSGQLTTATAMGDMLLIRLRRAGIAFERRELAET